MKMKSHGKPARTFPRMSTLFIALLLAVATIVPATAQNDAEPDGLRAIRNALKANDYASASERADTFLNAGGEQRDEALYLKGLALHHAREYVHAVETLDLLMSEHAESEWFRKARFLKADTFIKQRRFEDAEHIYEEEANRLLSTGRKKDVAGVFIRFADELSTEPDPNDLSAPPADHNKAYSFYRRALEMEVDRSVRDDVLYKLAFSAQRAGNHAQAVIHFHEYLNAFDPAWTGPVGSLQRMRGMKRETLPTRREGGHVLDARYRLGKSQLALSQWAAARQNFEDLLARLDDPAATTTVQNDHELHERMANTTWQIVRTYNMPNVTADEMDKAISTARTFLAAYSDHRHSVEAAWLVATTLHAHGRSDDAIAAYEQFASGENYDLPQGERATETIERLGKSAVELEAEWQPLAVYQVGSIRYAQQKYDLAIEAWRRYVNRFPNGPHWAAGQRKIIDAQFMIAVEQVAEEQYGDARTKLAEFLAANPLDSRAAQVLFILGEIEHSQEHWRKAVAEWDKLITKYPNTEESGLALYRTGVIYEEKLGELESALEAYRRLTWGSYGPMAQARVAIMTQKQLQLETQRTFRTDESPHIQVSTRNIETLTIRQYFLDPEAYFRKTHTIGGVQSLDIALIEPDRTWDVSIEEYAKYQPLEQLIDIPFEGDRPGVCIVNVSDDDWEATTLVVRSDLDLIMRTSRREAIVFVQNMRTNKLASNVSLIFSDGEKVFASGKTKDDGVFQTTLDELKSLSELRVFAIEDGHIASNALSLDGLNLSQGLSRKGYIYTDRPAYQPGQVVRARGIIRDVKNGSYVSPADAEYVITVTDPQGRLMRQETQMLSTYGTFNMAFALDVGASQGVYAIIARQQGQTAVTFSGRFLVQQFQLQKIELTFDFDRDVYFRGESVSAQLRAQYYWGEPVANEPIRYQLPDGRSFVEKTDDQGVLKITFDTTGVPAGALLTFMASIDSENVNAAGRVYVPKFGFDMKVSPSQELALADEPFDVTITTTAPNGEPLGRDITLLVLRRESIKPDPVLANVPWINLPRARAAEVTVEEHRVTTDEETGKGTIRLTLADGGDYILRVAGNDQFDQPVVASTTMRVSDDDDATRLRIFAQSNTLKVGEVAPIRLHSRVDGGVALITTEGETILKYSVVVLAKGNNPLRLKVDHEHFPNFALSVTMMDGRELRTATKPFEVERELKISIKPLADTYAPGETGTVELIVTDQLGRPVKAELGLALVNEALLAQYPDQTPEILTFFQHGARRFVEFRTAATNGFSYEAQTRATVKAFGEEEDRRVRKQSEGEQLAMLQDQLRGLMRQNRIADHSRFSDPRERANRPSPAQEAAQGGPFLGGGGGSGGGRGYQTTSGEVADAGFAWQRDRRLLDKRKNIAGSYLYYSDSESVAKLLGDIPRLFNSFGENVPNFFDGQEIWGAPRSERPEAGWWNASIVTDENGKATIEIPMPESTTRWQLLARGVTTQTLVGDATATVTTKQDFFIELKTPRAAMEGDQLRIFARIHNTTGTDLPVRFELTVSSGDKTYATVTKTVKPVEGELIEVLFDAFDVPVVGAIDITVKAAGVQNGQPEEGMADSVSRSIIVHPYGIPYAAHGGGVTSGSPRLLLELPKDLRYTSKWLTVTISPDLQQQIIDMALSSRPILRNANAAGRKRATPPQLIPQYGHMPGSELLAAVAGLRYAQDANAAEPDRARLAERCRSLISALVVSQNEDGGWSWAPDRKRSDFMVTAMSYWALGEARSMGLAVHADTLKKARVMLENLYQRAAAADYEQKAIILHALSAAGEADFKLANTLYRERNGLTPIALAYTALTLANLDRNDMAVEVLAVLESKAKMVNSGGRMIASWDAKSRHHPWLTDAVESTAIALFALMKASPASSAVEPAAQYLLEQYGCFGFANGRSRGVGVAALSQYFARGQFANADYELVVSINGRPVRSIKADGSTPSVVIDVPGDTLRDGQNEIAFDIKGRGRFAYAATLRGFSPEFKDPKTLAGGPYIHSRRYLHPPLDYRGVKLSTTSTSPVRNIEIGQRTIVKVDVYESSYNGYLVVEESIPAGMSYVHDSLQARGTSHHEVRDGKIIMYVPLGVTLRDYSYELVGYATGEYRALPTVIRDAFDPSKMRIHKPAEINVLAPGEESDDPYEMNDGERFALGTAHFDDGLYAGALDYLWPLFDRESKYQEREVARMLLWIHTTADHFNPDRVVEAFELLSVRHPDLRIPFDRILRVGEAYRYIGEFERAWLVFRATIESSFRNDSMISAVLEDEGQLLASFEYQEALWWEYPDIADVATSYFALAQTIYDESPNAHILANNQRRITTSLRTNRDEDGDDEEPITRVTMLTDAVAMLDNFLALYPENPLRDDAAFSMTSAFLDLKSYDSVVRLSAAFAEKFADSEYESSFQYMEALGWFWQRAYDKALGSARVVAQGDSRDRDFARYILGQIYHAEGRPGEAIEWYKKVRAYYPDASEAINYFERKRIALDEVNIFKPGEDIRITLDYRNIEEANLQVYKVDLMKLYLREKNLSNITGVNLAGISPQLVKSIKLGDGKDYADKEVETVLDLTDEGAYLVICRGDNLFASGLVLITPLEIEVQEDVASGRVRINLMNAIDDVRPAEVHIKVVGSADGEFESGETDLRGIFVADGVNGTVTAIARDAESRYAFYRGETWLGPRAADRARQESNKAGEKSKDVDYLYNVQQQQMQIQLQNRADFDAYRRGGKKGVEVQEAR